MHLSSGAPCKFNAALFLGGVVPSSPRTELARRKLKKRGTGGDGENGEEEKRADLPIITRAGTAFHSSQKVMKELVTRMIPGMKTVVK